MQRVSKFAGLSRHRCCFLLMNRLRRITHTTVLGTQYNTRLETRGESFCTNGGFKKNRFRVKHCEAKNISLATRVLGNGLGALAHCVLRQLTR